MKKKILILSIFIIFLLFFVLSFSYFLHRRNILKRVLNSLKENFSFCEILKDKISFKKGEFWMTCNSRPFYAEYKDGNVIYELNGWSFLKKDPILWSELENCDFYDSKDSELIFYCPKDFNSEKLVAKIYRFNKNTFKIEKLKEKNFLEVIGNDITSIYEFLLGCEIKNFFSTKYENFPAVLFLNFKCNDGEYIVGTDLATVPLQPPVLINKNLSPKEKAKISFEKSFGLPIKNIETIHDQVMINSSLFTIIYNYSEPIPTIYYSIKEIQTENDVKNRIKEFGKYFIFPPLKEMELIETLGEVSKKDVFVYKRYRIDKKSVISISCVKPPNIINAFWRKTEGIYR